MKYFCFTNTPKSYHDYILEYFWLIILFMIFTVKLEKKEKKDRKAVN